MGSRCRSPVSKNSRKPRWPHEPGWSSEKAPPVDTRYRLGAGGPRIEIDDAQIGGERTGRGSGRGRRGHAPFIAAIETSGDGRPLHPRLQVVRGFRAGETKRLCAGVAAGTTVVSDGGQWFGRIAAQPGRPPAPRRRLRSRRGPPPCLPLGEHGCSPTSRTASWPPTRVVGAKHLPRCLGAFAWRFNRRFALKTIDERLAIAATTTRRCPTAS